MWLAFKLTRITQLYQSCQLQKGHLGRRCTNFNDAIQSKHFVKFLIRNGVQFSSLEGKSDFVAKKSQVWCKNKVKSGR